MSPVSCGHLTALRCVSITRTPDCNTTANGRSRSHRYVLSSCGSTGAAVTLVRSRSSPARTSRIASMTRLSTFSGSGRAARSSTRRPRLLRSSLRSSCCSLLRSSCCSSSGRWSPPRVSSSGGIVVPSSLSSWSWERSSARVGYAGVVQTDTSRKSRTSCTVRTLPSQLSRATTMRQLVPARSPRLTASRTSCPVGESGSSQAQWQPSERSSSVSVVGNLPSGSPP